MRGFNGQENTLESRYGEGGLGGITQCWGYSCSAFAYSLSPFRNQLNKTKCRGSHYFLWPQKVLCISALPSFMLHLFKVFHLLLSWLWVHLPVLFLVSLVSTNLEAEPNPVIAYLMLLSIFRQKNILGHKVLCLFPEARFNDITWMTTTL